MKTKLTLLLLFVCALPAFSQEVIEIMNSSFENPIMDRREFKPLCCKSPRGWMACGRADLNTPDAQPGNFGVNLKAIDGSYYIGMVTRDNETWEAISSRLRTTLIADQEYAFSLALAKSDNLESQSRSTGKQVKYDKPIKIRIWGGNGYCKKTELLAQTKAISNTEWKYFDLVFKSKKNYNFLTIESYYVTPVITPYNGNILLDDLSPIIPVTSENDSLLTKIKRDRKAKILTYNSTSALEKTQTENLAKIKNYDREALPNGAKQLLTKEQKIAFRIESIKENSKNKAKGPVTWKAFFKNTSNNKYQILWEAAIAEGWKIYSQHNKPFKGAMGVHINIDQQDNFELISNNMESDNFEIIYDNFYKKDLRSFKKEASFDQIIDVYDPSIPILGNVAYALSHENGTIETKVFNFVILVENKEVIFEK